MLFRTVHISDTSHSSVRAFNVSRRIGIKNGVVVEAGIGNSVLKSCWFISEIDRVRAYFLKCVIKCELWTNYGVSWCDFASEKHMYLSYWFPILTSVKKCPSWIMTEIKAHTSLIQAEKQDKNTTLISFDGPYEV